MNETYIHSIQGKTANLHTYLDPFLLHTTDLDQVKHQEQRETVSHINLIETFIIYTITRNDGTTFGCYACFNREFWGKDDGIRWWLENKGNATHINGFITLS